ncbi:hypothetical protein [Aquisphaera insulae]|uniref:hypothetical protein n=1 Tax=Aquisphaera insulae TaxID=2712864 RepID=UPI0013EE3E63|nr:hypothetical protein [Aquisphaera insulae]
MTRIGWLAAVLAGLALSQDGAPAALGQAIPSPPGSPGAAARTAPPSADVPAAPAPGAGRLPDEFVIFNNVGDFADFLKRINQPDWIFTRPGEKAAPPTGVPAGVPGAKPFVVNRVAIRGKVDGDVASLRLELDLELLERTEAWIPLGIRSQIVTSAREHDQELELQGGGEGRWNVRLRGAGRHHLDVSLERPVRISPDRNHLEIAIPEASSTYLELDVPQAIRDVSVGPGESIVAAPLPEGKATRLTAHLSPRSMLSLSWTNQAGAGSPLPPLLTAQVEMSIDADAESVTTQSTWAIRCVRGQARRLQIQLDPADVARQVKLDDQFIPADIESNVLTIPLGEPLRPGDSRRLFMEIRRGFPRGGPRTFLFKGFALEAAAEQTGAIGVTQAANLWLNDAGSQGLRRIDPRELPSDLRTKPRTCMAFQFLDQPFKLSLSVEDAPPLLRATAATRIILDGETARSETTLDIQRVRGRPFEVVVAVPPGLELTSAGPAELVESVATVPAAPTTAVAASPPTAAPVPAGTGAAVAARPAADGKLARIRLTAVARDQPTFAIKLAGVQKVAVDGDASLALFTLKEGAQAGGTVAVLASRNVTFDPTSVPSESDGVDQASFRRLVGEERAAAVAGLTGGGRVPVAVLQSQSSPPLLRGRLRRHRPEISEDIKLAARVQEGSLEIRQETAIDVRYASIRELFVRVPVLRRDQWQVKGRSSITVTEAEPAADAASTRYRLALDPPIESAATLTFTLRRPLTIPEGESAARGAVDWVRIEQATTTGVVVELSPAPGISTEVEAAGWESADGGAVATGGSRTYRRTTAEAGLGLPFAAGTIRKAALPALVAPRMLLRTWDGPDGGSRTEAWYVIETHPGYAELSLPPAAQWIRARIDGRVAEQVERTAQGDGYRIDFPLDSRGRPVLLDIEYQAAAGPSGRDWSPPELRGGAVVMQSLWEIRTPWNQAVVGVPRGWGDENQWFWDVYVWKRKPRRPFAGLLQWLSASASSDAVLDDPTGDSQEATHAYLFSRPGPPRELHPWIASRAWLVAVCSGGALALGFWIMFSRSGPRVIYPALAAAAVLAVSLVHSSVLFLVLQSSLFGIVLAFLGLGIRRYTEGSPRAAGAETASPAAGSAISELTPSKVGSDDSTAIRHRPSSTMDYASPLSFTTGPDPSSGSRVSQAGR